MIVSDELSQWQEAGTLILYGKLRIIDFNHSLHARCSFVELNSSGDQTLYLWTLCYRLLNSETIHGIDRGRRRGVQFTFKGDL